MKHYPLAVKIWLVLAGVTLAAALLMAVLFPWALRSFFTREIYQTIEEAQLFVLDRQSLWLERPDIASPVARDQARLNIRTVNHVLLRDDGRPLAPRRVPAPFLRVVGPDALTQEQTVQRYSREVEGEPLYYLIRKENIQGRTLYLISYMWDSYRTDLVKTLFGRLVLVMAAVLVASWIPAMWLARYLSRPLVEMERHIKRIAENDWHEPFHVDRRDEIGRLAETFERMRQRLVRKDEAQQSFLQHVSHELKTPVMVIRSYAQSIQDGILPQGDLNRTVQVIDAEAERLEKRIRGLLYLTKLDYLAVREQPREAVPLHEVVREVVERLRWRRPELEWSLKLEPAVLEGDREQWSVAVENLVDNQMRYAERRAAVTLGSAPGEPGALLLRVWNDGPPIPQADMDELFAAFRKGERGQFGLGLAIVHRIAALHRADVWAQNEENGVSFCVRIPRRGDAGAGRAAT